MNSNELRPLADFEQLIQYGGVKRCYEDFILDLEQLSGTFTNEEKTEFEFPNFDDELFGSASLIKQTFHKKLLSKLNQIYSNTCLFIDQRVSTFENNNQRIEFIVIILDSIKFLLQEIEGINTFGELNTIKNYLLKVVEYINEKYSSLAITHNCFLLLGINNPIINEGGFFDFKYNMNYIPKIISTLQSLDFISDESSVSNDFRDIIISDNPKALDKKIIILCSVEKASYIFFKLQDYFRNLTFLNIEESNCFLNKSLKPFNANTISVSKSKFLSNIGKTDERQNIDLAFEKLSKLKN